MGNNTTWSFDEKAKELKHALVSFSSERHISAWEIPFFGKNHTVSAEDVKDSTGVPVNPAVSVVLMTYVMNDRHSLEPSSWIGFRECRGAGPLMGHFQENTAKTIEKTFSGKMGILKKASEKLRAQVLAGDAGFDLSLMFEALPGIPVLLRFNDADEGFAASCQILFRESAQDVLDIRSLGVIGTYLTGILLGEVL